MCVTKTQQEVHHTEIIVDDGGEQWEFDVIDGDEDLVDIVAEIAERHYLPKYL